MNDDKLQCITLFIPHFLPNIFSESEYVVVLYHWVVQQVLNRVVWCRMPSAAVPGTLAEFEEQYVLNTGDDSDMLGK